VSGALESSQKREAGHELLFVYGTLMRGGKLHHLLSPSPDVKFVGKAKIRAKLYLPQGENYPGAVATSSANRYVFGELYALPNPERVLKRLDLAEGCEEGLFIRRLVDTFQAGGKRKAWTYLYAKSVAGAELVPHGRFQTVRAAT
jgi:gamma-glutamylcyclotransferase (GGCT)/AIG2-like uncharacterized protein YtfP